MNDTNFAQPEDKGLLIESMDLEAQGIAHRPDGKVVFVEGALPLSGSQSMCIAKKITGSRVRCAIFWKNPRRG